MKIFKKNKSLLVTLALALVVGVAATVFAIQYFRGQDSEFRKSGYVLLTNEQAEAQRSAFSAGTGYRANSADGITFQDVQNKAVEVDKESFLHYEDGSIGALSAGVLLDTDDISAKDIINHYGTDETTVLERSGKRFKLKDTKKPIEMKEAIWKISDTRYLLCAENIQIVFDKKDIRDAGDFIEIKYIDAGVVQIVTKDNVWQSVSTSVYAKTANGTVLRLFDQVIEKNKQKMPLSKMVIHSDDNVELSALEKRNQQVPEFDIKSKDGMEGKVGNNGTEGNTGEEGSVGTNGNNGNKGSQGTSGGNGTSGGSGGNGKTGQNGSNATQESSAKTGLPQFSFKSWNITATGVSGVLNIEDENVMLTGDSAKIVLYEAGSGKAISCVNEKGEDGNFNVQGSEVSFQNDPAIPLKPDQEYRFVVSASYEMAEQTFTRDFVSRVFYTDSLGVLMEKEGVATDAVTIQLNKKDYSNATHADLYLLSEEEAKDFDAGKLDTYIHESVDLDEGAVTKSVTFQQKDYEKVKPNSSFVVRMRITSQGKDYLSQQVINLQTLKRTPTISGDPYVITNRQFGGFELYGGKVNDQDQAILKQYYEIYDAETGSDTYEKVVKTMEVEPSSTVKAVNLYLDGKIIYPNHNYRFGVKTVYSDNEKVVEIRSVLTDTFSMSSARYPALSFEEAEDGIRYDYIRGNLIIDKNGADIPIDVDHPLDIMMECEGVYSKTLNITNKDASGIVETSSQILVPISETGLKNDKIYRLSAVGFVDLKDGSDAQRRTIGNVVRSTPALTTLRADWKISSDSSNAVARTLKLSSSDGSWLDVDHAYDANTLSKIVAELYSGSDSGKVFMKSIEFSDTDNDPHTSTLVKDFIVNGKEINETDFGYPSSAMTNSVYTMKIKAVYDYTALDSYHNPGNISGYQNEYTVENSETVVSKASQPPALPDPSQMADQVISEPIYNKDAGSYGKNIDETLDETTIIGYKIRANYDNYAKLARNIDYYVFEANDYENYVDAKENLIYDETNKVLWEDDDDVHAHWVKRIPLSVAASSTNIPTAAVFFGEGEDTTYYGMNIVYAGKVDAENNGNLRSGMGRGYKYVFAYALKYNETGAGEATKLYPYHHPKYDTITKDAPYMLNSGVQEAPKTNPQFTAYPYDSKSYSSSQMNMSVKMRYSDPDHTVTPYDPAHPDEATQIILNNTSVGNIEVAAGAWQTTNFTNLNSTNLKNGNILNPMISRKLYVEDYKEESAMEIFQLPVDLSATYTKEMVEQLSYSVSANLDNNLITIQLLDPSSGGYLSNDLHRKIAGIEATFIDTTDDTKKITLPLTINSANKATVSSGKLDALLGKELRVEVKLIYDNNEQGWKLGENSATRFALQNVDTSSTNIKLSKYRVYFQESGNITTSEDASGSIFQSKTWLDPDAMDGDLNISIFAGLRNLKDEYNYALKMVENGISFVTYDPEAREVFVPKKLNQTAVPTPSANVTFVLDRIVPTVTMSDNYTSQLNNVILYNVDFAGTKLIDEESGRKYITLEIKNKTTNVVTTQKVDVTSWSKGTPLVITALEEDTKYEVRFVTKLNGTDTYLLDGSRASPIIMVKDVATRGTVTISNLEVSYKPESYETKLLYAEYRLDQTSGFMIQYRILDKDGNEVMSNQDMIDRGLYAGYTPGQPYGYNMSVSFNLQVGKHGLKPGESYQLEVSSYLLDEDDEVKDTPIGTETKPFTIPQAKNPISFINMSPQFDAATKQIDLNAVFSMSDNDKVIMSDYSGDVRKPSHYFVRFYEQESGKWKDITADGRQEYELSNSYSVSLKDLKADTNYKLVMYATIDKNHDGIDDSDDTIKGSISSLSEEEFLNKKDTFILWEEVCVTPGENGIAFGDVALENPNNDPTRISIAYKNASNLSAIDKVDYTVISSDGVNTFSGSLFKDKEDIFVEKAGVKGYYNMDLPIVLEEKGVYRVMISYYQKDGSSYVKLEPSYATTYLYEK